MKIDKVYNNNVVQVINDNQQEEILMGRGLGFQKKVGDQVELSQIEKRFILQDKNVMKDLSSVYTDLSLEEIETISTIIEHGQDILGTVYDLALYISLADHLHYTLERVEKGLVISNPLSWEIRKFFPKEFQAGRDALLIVKEKLKVDLPEDEVASIALHFINAQKDANASESGQKMAKIVTTILDIVRFHRRNRLSRLEWWKQP